MNLDFNEQQKILSNSAQEFLRKECPKKLMRQRRDSSTEFNRELWEKMADLGWMGVAIDEDYGGREIGSVRGSLPHCGRNRRIAVHCSGCAGIPFRSPV